MSNLISFCFKMTLILLRIYKLNLMISDLLLRSNFVAIHYSYISGPPCVSAQIPYHNGSDVLSVS